MSYPTALSLLLLLLPIASLAQAVTAEATEDWSHKPPLVAPATQRHAPSDAVVLFAGVKDLDKWEHADGIAVKWTVKGDALTIVPKTKDIRTKQSFGSMQLHIEWRTPAEVKGESQGRGNSGIFFMGRYELQVLDSYNNKTYTNGQAGSIYKQSVPLANPTLKPGEWNTYDVIWTAPVFDADGALVSPAKVTVTFNGVVVQNGYELKGPTQYIGQAAYRQAHGASPIKLQAHGDKSEPLSFRNIWVRELP